MVSKEETVFVNERLRTEVETQVLSSNLPWICCILFGSAITILPRPASSEVHPRYRSSGESRDPFGRRSRVCRVGPAFAGAAHLAIGYASGREAVGEATLHRRRGSPTGASPF